MVVVEIDNTVYNKGEKRKLLQKPNLINCINVMGLQEYSNLIVILKLLGFIQIVAENIAEDAGVLYVLRLGVFEQSPKCMFFGVFFSKK